MKRSHVYAYSWHLPSIDQATVQSIMESIREFCIELGCEEVSDLGVKHDWVGFTAVVPNARQHEFSLAFSAEDLSWKTSGWLHVSSFREISQVMFNAAKEGILLRTGFVGMEIIYRRNALGVIETEQRSAFDPDTF